MSSLFNMLPATRWLKSYGFHTLRADLIAALLVTAMLIPQAMAYAMLAGLPPIMGLYASIVPMIVYAFLGGSPTLSIGPVAIISMMTAATLSPIFTQGTEVYIQAASLLALMSGTILVLLGICRFGFLIQLISHPVIKSFIIASAILIALGQLKFLLDIPLSGHTLASIASGLFENITLFNMTSVLIGLMAILCLVFIPKYFKHIGLPHADIWSKLVPLILVMLGTFCVYQFHLDSQFGIKTVGIIPSGFPPLFFPDWNWVLVKQLLPGAFMIAMISFVESLSIAQATALQTRNDLNSNQELFALGIANLGAGLTSSFPVTGSLSRTVINADAGAQTPFAGLFGAIFIIVTSLYLTELFIYLPLTVLAATIIVSIWKLVEVKTFIETWRYSKADGIAMVLTALGVLLSDVSTGLLIGMCAAFILLLWRMSRPHIAMIGQVPNTQHFRNMARHQVITSPNVAAIRVDESLNFLNANALKNYIISALSNEHVYQHVVINASSISSIDLSALEMLEDLNNELKKLGIQLHFAEVKGPVMDRIAQSHFIHHLTGKIFLSQFEAMQYLAPEIFVQGHQTTTAIKD